MRDGVTDLRPSGTAVHNRGCLTQAHTFTVSYTPFTVALQIDVLLNVAQTIGYHKVLSCASSA